MANPPIANLPVVLIEEERGTFEVSVWHPPSGIWRKSGDVDTFVRFEEALNLATHLSQATGATMAISFAAANEQRRLIGQRHE